MNPRPPLVLAVLAVLAAACGDNESSVGEICNNGFDDDRDGITDCFDSDCRDMPACTGGGERDCDNVLDDDHDGLADCGDPDCFDDAACAASGERDCANGLDDDGDGATDCADAECVGTPGCVESACADGRDDDGDGDTDCADFDCAVDAGCRPATCAEDAHEDNDDRATATAWTALTSTEYLAVRSGDDDHVAIPVCAGAVVDIVAHFAHASGDINLDLQSAAGSTIRTSGGTTDREAIRWRSYRAGTVYLRVNLYGSSATGCNSFSKSGGGVARRG